MEDNLLKVGPASPPFYTLGKDEQTEFQRERERLYTLSLAQKREVVLLM